MQQILEKECNICAGLLALNLLIINRIGYETY